MPDQGKFRFSGWALVEVGRISDAANITGCSHLRELNLAGDHAPVSTAIGARILDGVLQVHERPRILLRRRGQSSLKYGQGKPNSAFAAFACELFGAVELVAHILGHTLVQVRFTVGKLVFDGIGLTFRKQWTTVKLEQVLLNHPAHQIAGIYRMNAVAKLALEAVPIQQRHEQLKVLFLSVVGRGGQKQKIMNPYGRMPLTVAPRLSSSSSAIRILAICF